MCPFKWKKNFLTFHKIKVYTFFLFQESFYDSKLCLRTVTLHFHIHNYLRQLDSIQFTWFIQSCRKNLLEYFFTMLWDLLLYIECYDDKLSSLTSFFHPFIFESKVSYWNDPLEEEKNWNFIDLLFCYIILFQSYQDYEMFVCICNIVLCFSWARNMFCGEISRYYRAMS